MTPIVVARPQALTPDLARRIREVHAREGMSELGISRKLEVPIRLVNEALDAPVRRSA